MPPLTPKQVKKKADFFLIYVLTKSFQSYKIQRRFLAQAPKQSTYT